MDTFTKDLETIKEDIKKIKERNKRVEADKAWEVSRTRTFFIAGSTFLLLFIFLLLINADNPFFNALISSIVYIASTETYGILKKWWLHKRR